MGLLQTPTMSDPSSTISAPSRNLDAFQQWKARVKRLFVEYFAWLKRQGLLSAEIEEQFGASLQALNQDELTLALVAEFSRGKSNLINAIFFADQDRHFLPSSVGRTTMCPVEIHHDRASPEPCLRLLPIETLQEDGSLSRFKQQPEAWQTLPLDMDDPGQMQRVLQEVKLTRTASLEEAECLGLAWVEKIPEGMPEAEQAAVRVEIPKWRHALLNFPHPWLQQGLRILDTPGLNALGTEPELLLRLLPGAQVIIFILGADTGVTQSDLDIWRGHIKADQKDRGQKVLVVLNKIDSLWSELATPDEIQMAVDHQVQATARVLGIPSEQIFPLSAHKALVARVKGDDALLEQSGILAFERHLFHDLLEGRCGFLAQSICASLGQLLDQHLHLFQTRLLAMKRQRSELFRLSDKSNTMLTELSGALLLEKKQYLQVVDAVRVCRQALEAKSVELAQILSPGTINTLAHEAEAQMRASLTTLGLKKAMQALFDRLNAQILAAGDKVEEIRDILLGLYRWLEHQDGYSLVQPKGFSIIKYKADLDRLHQEAGRFRKGAQVLVSGKSLVIRRFLNALAQEALLVFEDAARDARTNWLKLALEPILYQVRDHKDMLDRKGLDLQRIGQSRETLAQRIKDLHADMLQVTGALDTLRRFKADNAKLMAKSGCHVLVP